ncbi:MAG TPA: AAA family ATPase, partial [Myxococcaceae bacterium]
MVESITLQNFKSFGEQQTVPLEPITVLVGPNNSGKSNFMSVGRFLTNSLVVDVPEAIRQEGGFFFHRPLFKDHPCTISWTTPEGAYTATLSPTGRPLQTEQLDSSNTAASFTRSGGGDLRYGLSHHLYMEERDSLAVRQLSPSSAVADVLRSVWKPFSSARAIKLALGALREDSEVVPEPQIGIDGRGLAAVLGLWRGSVPEKAEALQSFLTRCLPEMANVFVRPAPVPGHQRLWFKQKD